MCRYLIGQKIELWKIEGGKHPHRVVDRRIVTIGGFVGTDEKGDPLSLQATDCRKREYYKPRPPLVRVVYAGIAPKMGKD